MGLEGRESLSSDRRRAEALFERALSRAEGDREEWLAEACRDDPSLLGLVKALLESHRRSSGILDRRLPIQAFPDAPLRVSPPRPLGPYRIVREVGRGGMGVVYLAERSDGTFRRRVALKLLRGEHDAEALHRRLEAERQILAALDHPGIARLLDGGITEDGRPYLVMEFVEGESITAHCDRQYLPVEARLHLFLTVARAVQHAHARLVVHRDLKPSNILVTESGEVRLLDFGIAKVLDPARIGMMGGEAPATRTGLRLLTPEYASPEQLRGEPAATSNDIWAMGVLLYELLCGDRPFRAEEGSDLALERAILEADPTRPSFRVRDGDPEWARARGRTPRALSRLLSGDLDRIVLMALRKELERRYASAAEFAEDVERYLSGLPVRAQPDRTTYRVGKFLRRYRMEVGAAAMVLLSLIVGAGGALWQARDARMERDRAAAEALRSEAVSEYLLDLFRTADPWEVPADRMTARQLLARGQGRLDELPEDAILRARVALALGDVYRNLGDARSSRPLLEEAVALRRGALGGDHPDTGEALRALAELLRREGALGEAEETALAALEASRRGVGRGSGGASVPAGTAALGEAAGLTLLGFIYTGKADLPLAASYFQEASEVLLAGGLQDHPDFGAALVNLAAIHRRRGHLAEAEEHLREALTHRRRTMGPDHPLTAVALARLAGLLSGHLNRHDEAEELFLQALEIQTRMLGEDHASRGEPLAELAYLYEARGDLEQAEAFFRETVRTLGEGLGKDHREALAAEEQFADFLGRRGRLLEADSIYRATLDVRRETLGPDHTTIAHPLLGWGRVLLALDHVEEAESVMMEALALRKRDYGPEHPMVGLALADLSLLHARKGDRDAEEVSLLEALAMLEGMGGLDNREVLRVRELLARMYEERGDVATFSRFRRPGTH